MASSTLKGLVANSGKLGYQLWHRPLKMASLVYEREIGNSDLKKNSGSERDSNPRPLRCRCSQLSYQSHMRAVVYGLALYMGTFRLGPSTVKMKVICPIVATE